MKKRDYLDHNLKELLTSTKPCLHMPADRKADVLSRLLQKAATSTEDERASMSWIKWAVAAMVLLAVVFSICFLDKSGVAFADILKNLQQRGYTFTYWSRQEDGELKEMGRGMVLQPGLIRWDIPHDQWEGLAIVVDAINHKTRWVTTTGKDLGEAQMPKEAQNDPNRYQSQQNFLLSPVETLWELIDGTEQSLGRTTKDDIEVIGYRVEKTLEVLNQKAAFIYTIWANVSTGLPYEVTMEVKDLTGENGDFVILLRDFNFDAAVDESLFGLNSNQEPEDVNDALFIVHPGVGMGELHLGDPSDKVTKILGKPDFMIGEGLYQYTGLVVVAREGKVYSFQGGDANGPGTRHAQQCRLRTAEGVGMGSSEQEIVEVYGEPTRRTIQQGDVHIGYRSKGMGFILRDNKVYLMSFGNPRQKK